jgi:hypothetical protein
MSLSNLSPKDLPLGVAKAVNRYRCSKNPCLARLMEMLEQNGELETKILQYIEQTGNFRAINLTSFLGQQVADKLMETMGDAVEICVRLIDGPFAGYYLYCDHVLVQHGKFQKRCHLQWRQ